MLCVVVRLAPGGHFFWFGRDFAVAEVSQVKQKPKGYWRILVSDVLHEKKSCNVCRVFFVFTLPGFPIVFSAKTGCLTGRCGRCRMPGTLEAAIFAVDPSVAIAKEPQ